MLPYLLIAQLYCTDTVRGRDFVVMCEYFQTVQIDSVYRIDEDNGRIVFTQKNGEKVEFIKANVIGWSEINGSK